MTRERFLEVCKELEAALNREQEAEKLLTQQANQIQEIGAKLDHYLGYGGGQEQSLNQIEQVCGE